MQTTSGESLVQSPQPWQSVPRWVRYAISAWLLFHIMAICLPPLAVRPSSELTWQIAQLVRPYLQALYLNHGFHYFAPQPGDSTLVEFTVETTDGATIRGVMPNRKIWPRQLYHRHFMLTESLSYLPDELLEDWHASYARCLARKYDGRKVELTHVRHFTPSPQMVRDGVTLENPESYLKTPMGSFVR